MSLDNLSNQLILLMDEIQDDMFKKATVNREKLITEVNNYNEFQEVMMNKRGYLKAFWCEDKDCETAIKVETKATTRCLPFIDNSGNVAEEVGSCVKCGEKANHRWLFAQAY